MPLPVTVRVKARAARVVSTGRPCDWSLPRCWWCSGWHGPDCSLPCAQGSWGLDCNRSCRCRPPAGCDPASGDCACPPGWRGEACELAVICNMCVEAGDRLAANNTCPNSLLRLNGGSLSLGSDSHLPPAVKLRLYGGSLSLFVCVWVCCEQPGSFGRGCRELCDCGHAEQCDRVTGRCLCHNGWTGVRCDSACAPGRWGPNCSRTCGCHNGASCRPADGACECAAGYRGTTCQRVCPPGTFGLGCAQACPQCLHGNGPCHHVTGECRCLPGFTGQLCDQACPPGRYGRGCREVCACANNSSCSHVDGTCHCTPGWLGRDCSQACPPGLWGANCLHTCSCHNGAGCSARDGGCTCSAGWMGAHCTRRCPVDLFGAGCAERCACENGADCESATGRCSCPAGFTGARCQLACPQGSYGLRCQLACGCTNNSTCDPVSGTCYCASGWTGMSCDSGNARALLCTAHCAAGGESLGAVVGVVLVLLLLLLLLLALLLLAVFYRRRRRRLRGLARGGRREPGAGAAAAAASFSAGAARSVASDLYVNPGYQTLSQGHSAQGIANNNLELRCTGRPNNARVPAMKNLEREKLAARCAEGSATLPVLWKRSTNPYQLGASGVERAYNTCKSHKEYSKGSRGSSGSVGSESPYATIRETPALPASPAPARSPPPPAGGGPVSPPRGSEAAGYVEMKAPGGPGGPGGPRESTYAEIVCSPAHGLAGHAATGSTRNVYEMEPTVSVVHGGGGGAGGTSAPAQLHHRRHHHQHHQQQQQHHRHAQLLRRQQQQQQQMEHGLYDLPKNSHIPGHYDLLPVHAHPQTAALDKEPRLTSSITSSSSAAAAASQRHHTQQLEGWGSTRRGFDDSVAGGRDEPLGASPGEGQRPKRGRPKRRRSGGDELGSRVACAERNRCLVVTVEDGG
ncbi:unnamed protein product [Lampetra planeri]